MATIELRTHHAQATPVGFEVLFRSPDPISPGLAVIDTVEQAVAVRDDYVSRVEKSGLPCAVEVNVIVGDMPVGFRDAIPVYQPVNV